MVTLIGFIGTGHIGSQIARAVTAAGYDVILSNAHDPASLGPLAAELGDRASAATVDKVAAVADVVVVAVPIRAFASLPVAPLAGKVVIVTSNYNRDREGAVPALDSGETTVPGLLQADLSGAYVIRAFSHISSAEVTTAGRPAGTAHRRALAIAGDDQQAKQVVTGIYDAVGFDTLDLGGLDEAWRVDRGQPAFIAHQDLAELKANVARADRSRSGR
jgi:8-hydroxy-5-deazaflavin:NADPH oxidoreductase